MLETCDPSWIHHRDNWSNNIKVLFGSLQVATNASRKWKTLLQLQVSFAQVSKRLVGNVKV